MGEVNWLDIPLLAGEKITLNITGTTYIRCKDISNNRLNLLYNSTMYTWGRYFDSNNNLAYPSANKDAQVHAESNNECAFVSFIGNSGVIGRHYAGPTSENLGSYPSEITIQVTALKDCHILIEDLGSGTSQTNLSTLGETDYWYTTFNVTVTEWWKKFEDSWIWFQNFSIQVTQQIEIIGKIFDNLKGLCESALWIYALLTIPRLINPDYRMNNYIANNGQYNLLQNRAPIQQIEYNV